MIPFAMESHGAVGESARRLLFKLASKVSDISAQAFLQQTYARLSVLRIPVGIRCKYIPRYNRTCFDH